MKKLSRLLLFVAGGLFAILAAALLAVNLYVQSQRTHARIQEELSQRLGTTLRIQRISVTPWFGLKLTGITMPQTEPGISGDFLRAETFRLRIRLFSLFSGRLVITEVSLVSPTVTWAQNADGKWRLPSSLPQPEEVSVVENEAPSPHPVESPTATGSAIPAMSAPAKVAESQTVSFTPEVRRVSLSKGNFHFQDEKGAPVASFDGVRFRSDFRSATELSGRTTIKKISLRNRFFLNDLESPVEYDPERLHLSEIRAHAGEGDVTGEFDLHQSEEDSPFMAKVNFRGVQVDRVLTEAGGPAGMLKGRIEGQLDAHGKTADANALSGVGEIYLRDGEVHRYSLLVALGQILQLEDLAQLKLDQAYVKYHITPGVVMVDDLMLSSPNIRLSAKGTVGFNGKLRLDSQLVINEKVRGQLFRAVRENFHSIEEAGFAAIDFQVSGTLERPKTNLMGKLIGSEAKDLGGIINSLLGGKTPKPARLPNSESLRERGESSTATPAPTP